MIKLTALIKPVAPVAHPARLRLVAAVVISALTVLALGVVAVAYAPALSGGPVSAGLVLFAVVLLAATLLLVSLLLQRARAELALMVLDLDNLKSINDSLGHSVGDEVLRGTAQRIMGCLRSTDIVSRLSGDEFAVLLPRVGERSNVEVIAHRIVDAVERPYPSEMHSCTISASVGVVMLDGERSPGELLRNADVALLAAKREGKGRYVLYRRELHASEVERIAFERDLRTALDQDQFVLHYQPIVDSKNRRILGVEALVRWRHPERGLVPPLDFIPLAEETGLIVPLGAWVLREACQQTQRWRANHPSLFKDFLLSVNVSARQLFGTQLQNDVVDALTASGLDPRHLVLEIVESQV